MTRRRPRRSINESWLMVPPESTEARPSGDEDGQDARGAAELSRAPNVHLGQAALLSSNRWSEKAGRSRSPAVAW